MQAFDSGRARHVSDLSGTKRSKLWRGRTLTVRAALCPQEFLYYSTSSPPGKAEASGAGITIFSTQSSGKNPRSEESYRDFMNLSPIRSNSSAPVQRCQIAQYLPYTTSSARNQLTTPIPAVPNKTDPHKVQHGAVLTHCSSALSNR